ncbi:urease accessory protein UreF [Bosea sp. (in: a-proteobacteria)]|uniref:urease accessory protein UreF n=1 Tax=Bosea sp. (in: a-proteobacteria) TaxID=1871050 RepID=UPI002612F6B0|nr:urease accessory protein UreF [Bosea sp. (in: a-proteobacteria)]MCO5089793.1 urease accessory protein UreF [Bosea sp. (in: a-proteobacteria)]
MTETVALVRLMTWLSPAFPVGAFAYSHGLERAIHDGLIPDRASLIAWLEALLERGSVWNDAVLLAEAWRKAGAGEGVDDVAELAAAMSGSRERYMETTLQGGAFVDAMASWSGEPPDGEAGPAPYPVAVGAAAARHGVGLEDALSAYLHGFASNLVQVCVRLVPLGQRDGVAALAALEPVVLRSARRAATSTPDDLGACSIRADILSMQHETQYSRVFRS